LTGWVTSGDGFQTLQLLWELYIQEYPGGYQYSQYCLNFHRWRKSPDVVMHIEHFSTGGAR